MKARVEDLEYDLVVTTVSRDESCFSVVVISV